MKNFMLKATLITALALPAYAMAKPLIFACEPEWGALAHELLKDDADIYVATTAAQDPHHIEARPSLLSAVRRADMVICTGAELESGWLPILLRESGNDNIQPGSAGFFMASDYVNKLDIPNKVDRSEGDVHAAGNPHIQLDPRNLTLISQALANAMQVAFPDLKNSVSKNEGQFLARWKDAVSRWNDKASPLRGTPVIVQHTTARYLLEWLGMPVIAALEPEPGIPPNASHLSKLLEIQKKTPAQAIVIVSYEDVKPAQWFSDQTGLPLVVIPTTVGAGGAASLFELFDYTLDKLTTAVSAHAKH